MRASRCPHGLNVAETCAYCDEGEALVKPHERWAGEEGFEITGERWDRDHDGPDTVSVFRRTNGLFGVSVADPTDYYGFAEMVANRKTMVALRDAIDRLLSEEG